MRAKRKTFKIRLTQLLVAGLVALPFQFVTFTQPAEAADAPGSINFVNATSSPSSLTTTLSESPGTGDLTYEFWFNLTNNDCWPQQCDIFSTQSSANSQDGLRVTYTGGEIHVYSGNTYLAGMDYMSNQDLWTHMVFMRKGSSSWVVYKNGNTRTTFTLSSTNSTKLILGSETATPFKGKIANFRYAKSALYSDPNFATYVPNDPRLTVPTAPHVATAETKVLLNTVRGANFALDTSASANTFTLSAANPPTSSTDTPLPIKLDQATLTVSSSSGTFGDPITLSTAGGSGTGTLSYTVVSGNCTVSGYVLSSTSAGNCVVTATKSSDATYSAITSANKTIAIAKKQQVFSYSISSSSGAFKYGDTYTVTMNFPADAVAGASSWNVLKASTAWGINGAGDQVCSGGTISAGAVTCVFNSASLWPNAQALNVTGLHVRFNGSTNYEAFSHTTPGTKIDLSATTCGLVVCPSTNAVNVQATNKSISYGANLGGTGFESPYGDTGGQLRYSITNGANGANRAWGIGCTSTYQTGDPVGTYPIVCTGTTRPSGAPTPVTDAWVIANTNYQALYDANVENLRFSLRNPRIYNSAADWWNRGSFYTSDTYSNLTFSAATLTVSPASLATPTITGTTAVSSSSISVAFSHTAPAAASYTLRIFQSDGTTLVGSARTNYVSGTTVSGLTESTTYKVSITAVGDGSNTSTSSASSLSSVTTPAPTSYVVTFSKQNNSSAITTSVTNGSVATAQADPTWYGYNFKGWSESANGALVDVSTIAISSAKTFYAIWEQKSIAGLSSAQLGTPDIIAPHATLDKTATAGSGNTSSLVKVPAGALPSTYSVKVYTLADNDIAEQTLGAENTYIISQVVAWSHATDGTIQDTAAGKPIEMTITSPEIKSGAKVYSILGNITTLLATATQDGSVRVTFSADPVIVVQAAPIVPPLPTPIGGGGATPTSSPTPSAVPVTNIAKSFNVIGFNPGSWQLTKNIKRTIDAFFKSVNKPSKISCVGYTMGPTVLRGDYNLAMRRGQEVCKYVVAKNPTIAKMTTKGTTTRISDGKYRRTTINWND